MDKSSLALQRRKLKHKLFTKRKWFCKKGYFVLCALCDKEIYSGAGEMHEALITRGDCGGRQDLLELVMVEENCVLVHSRCHQLATMTENQEHIIARLIEEEGHKKILVWLQSIDDEFRSGVVERAINLLQLVNEGVSDVRRKKEMSSVRQESIRP